MKNLFSCFGVAAFLACVWVVRAGAQNPRDPFIDHNDNGETIHVLPPPAAVHSPRDTQPTDAPVVNGTAVFPPSYGSGNLNDHGGPEIPDAQFRAIYWNSSVANSTATSLGYATIKDQINGFANVFSDGGNWDNSPTDDYTIVQQLLWVSQQLQLQRDLDQVRGVPVYGLQCVLADGQDGRGHPDDRHEP